MATKIEWTHFEGFGGETWNPSVGCDQISAGCGHCYAKALHDKRHKAYMEGSWDNAPSQYRRLFEEVTFIPGRVGKPLHWTAPRAVFVNSVSDIFHEGISFEEIAAIFAVMGACPRHIFILLTKRHERMARFYETLAEQEHPYVTLVDCAWEHLVGKERDTVQAALASKERTPWPFPNVIVGVSVENQETANVRVPAVLKVPAAVRLVSYEPALAGVSFGEETPEGWYSWLDGSVQMGCGTLDAPEGHPTIDWLICGGESGSGARPFEISWAHDAICQCRNAETKVFLKQVGAAPYDRGRRMKLTSPKGDDPSEWAKELRVREFPDLAPRYA